ncbi:oxygenase MpaB family protein [Microbispora hainanensis]|nr:oxygenase MpaB family protein [Microbispora hainanensis]
MPPEQVTEESFARRLPHPDMPEVDLVIRTSGEQRISNLMLWQVAYAEWVFPPGAVARLPCRALLGAPGDLPAAPPPVRRHTGTDLGTGLGTGLGTDTDRKGTSMSDAAPGSMLHELTRQTRWGLVATRAIVLEAAHPQIGAALITNSTFVAHPWRRLRNTVLSAQRMVDPDIRVRQREAARLNRLHARITGTDAEGRPFNAADSEARAWVVATLFESTVTMCRLSGESLDGPVLERLYAEFQSFLTLMDPYGGRLPRRGRSCASSHPARRRPAPPPPPRPPPGAPPYDPPRGSSPRSSTRPATATSTGPTSPRWPGRSPPASTWRLRTRTACSRPSPTGGGSCSRSWTPTATDASPATSTPRPPPPWPARRSSGSPRYCSTSPTPMTTRPSM